jgi:hypothetical protein
MRPAITARREGRSLERVVERLVVGAAVIAAERSSVADMDVVSCEGRRVGFHRVRPELRPKIIGATTTAQKALQVHDLGGRLVRRWPPARAIRWRRRRGRYTFRAPSATNRRRARTPSHFVEASCRQP